MYQPSSVGVVPHSYSFPTCGTRESETKCQRCLQKCRSFSCGSFGLTLIIFTYTSLGALIFLLIEGRVETPKKRTNENEFRDVTLKTVERLWAVTEDLNILYKDNWTSLASLELRKYQEELAKSVRSTVMSERYSYKHAWTFPMALLYSLTLISTVGYGYFTPRTLAGKIFTTCYAGIGIPLFLLYLSSIGETIASVLREVRRKVCTCRNRGEMARLKHRASSNSISNNYSYPPTFQETYFLAETKRVEMTNGTNHANHINSEVVYVPLTVCFLLVFIYVVCGGFLFASLENWDVLDSICLCFSLLATVGFGTLLPGTHVNDDEKPTANTVSLILFYFYIIIGMAFMATCFAALQERAAPLVMRFKRTSFCKENGSPGSNPT